MFQRLNGGDSRTIATSEVGIVAIWFATTNARMSAVCCVASSITAFAAGLAAACDEGGSGSVGPGVGNNNSGATTGGAAVAVGAEERDRVRASLAVLPERQATALLLRHAGHSYREIATALGVAEGSVGVLLARGERAFRRAHEEMTR